MFSEQYKIQQQLVSKSNASVSSVNPKEHQNFFLIALDTNAASNVPNFSKSDNVTLLLHPANILNHNLAAANNASTPPPASGTNIVIESIRSLNSEPNYGVNLEEKETDEEEESLKSFICSACNKTFLYNGSLKRHIRKFHSSNPILLESLKPKKALIYACDKCKCKFSSKRNLVFHQRKKHGAELYIRKQNHICSICQSKFKKTEIMDHYTVDHGIEIKKEELNFRTFENFMSWKWDIEVKTETRYITQNHYYHKDGSKLHFMCQRSGNFETKSKGLRRLKRQGSTKINAYCPAAIHITELKDGTCKVIFLSTHIGHENNFGHLSEIRNELKASTSNNSAQISASEKHDSKPESELQGFHLLTKNDLNNIEKSFNLNFGDDIKNASDCDNVDIWMQEYQNSQNSCVLFYKLQGQTSDFSCLDNNDYMLVVMTKAQEEILKKFSTDCICIDRTHSVNSYGYELITLLALDSLQRGLPCAFLITNRTDETTLSIFYSLVKQKVGELQPQIFLSDVESSFYNAWIIEMSMPVKRLFCSWHVDWSWKKYLTEINGKEKQIKVYKMLKALLLEQDTERFNITMKSVVKYLNDDPDTKNFASYFKTYYEQTTAAWACCHNVQNGLNINMQIEKMHQSLKYIYLSGKHIKRLDLVIYCIMRFIRNKMITRLMITNQKKLGVKLKDLENRHKASAVMSSQVLRNKNGWHISSENNEIHYIQEVSNSCMCDLLCPNCKICIHRYSCSCIDSTLKWNMCKHIHFLCHSQNLNCDTTNKEDIAIKEVCQENKSPALTLEERRDALKNNYLDLIDSLTHPAQLARMERNLKYIKSKLNIMKSAVQSYND